MAMGPKKRMTLAFVSIAIVIVAGALLWRHLFGVPNPPLPSAHVAIVASSTASAGSSSVSLSSSSTAPSADSSSVDIPNPTLPEERLSLDGASWTVELATTMVEQARGLSYRTSLGADAGMLFIFPSPGVQNFWMKDMHFPLDIIWIAGDGTVAGFAQDAPAPAPGTPLWSLPVYTSPSGVNEVLEVNAGTVARYGIKVGDAVTVSPLR